MLKTFQIPKYIFILQINKKQFTKTNFHFQNYV